MITNSDLRTAFPEFSDTGTYPDSQISFWLAQGVAQYDQVRFGTQYTLAVLLFVAHNIVLSALAARAVATGSGLGGLSLAPVTSKSVGGVSKSMDVGLTAYAGAGPYNATPYGQRLYMLIRASAVGPFYRPHNYSTAGVSPYGAYPYR